MLTTEGRTGENGNCKANYQHVQKEENKQILAGN